MTKAPYEKTLYIIETANCGLLLLTLTVALTFSFQEGSGIIPLWNAYGFMVPFVLIKYIAEKYGRKNKGRLVTILLSIISIFLAYGNVAKVAWGAGLFIFLIAALYLPRPDGKILMTKPQIWHFVPFPFLYAIGSITSSFEIIISSVLFALLSLLLFLMDRNMNGCRKRIRESSGDVESRSILRENRRLLTLYILLFLLLAAVALPLIASMDREKEESPVSFDYYGFKNEQIKKEHSLEEKEIVISKEGRKLNLGNYGQVLLWGFAIIIAIALFLILYAFISFLLSIDDEKKKHKEKEDVQFFSEKIVEKQTIKNSSPKRFSPEGKVRRMYKKLVLKEAKGENLKGKTVGDIENNILLNDSSKKIGEIYNTVRYSSLECKDFDVVEMKKSINEYNKNKKSSKWSGSHT